MPSTVLLTSLGSGVCTAVLDCLEGRRDDLVLIGVGADPDVPDRARCDDYVEVPLTADPAWGEAVTGVAQRTAARAIIPGRCDDVVALARLATTDDQLAHSLLAGPMPLASQLRDTGLAAEFARRHGLPFAATVRTGLPASAGGVEDLLHVYAGPWVIKPSSGQASRGARITRDPFIVRESALLAAHVIQPFLGIAPPELDIEDPLRVIDVLSMRDADVQVILGPESQVLATGAFATTMAGGHVIGVERHPDPDVGVLAATYATALAAAGWRGPVNIQAAQSADGRWLPFEINPRFGGGSHARTRLGFGEVDLCLQAWIDGPTSQG